MLLDGIKILQHVRYGSEHAECVPVCMQSAIGLQLTLWEEFMFLQLSFHLLQLEVPPSKPVNNPLFHFQRPRSISK